MCIRDRFVCVHAPDGCRQKRDTCPRNTTHLFAWIYFISIVLVQTKQMKEYTCGCLSKWNKLSELKRARSFPLYFRLNIETPNIIYFLPMHLNFCKKKTERFVKKIVNKHDAVLVLFCLGICNCYWSHCSAQNKRILCRPECVWRRKTEECERRKWLERELSLIHI